jgi:hypothetical protein
MKKFSHVICLEDVVEDDIVIFKKGEVYPIISFDWKSLVYYIEPEYYVDCSLPSEYAIPPLHPCFEFLEL